MSGLIESVAQAIHESDGLPLSMARSHARVALKAMRDHTVVYREDGLMVHQLIGAPDDIWKMLLDAALAE